LRPIFSAGPPLEFGVRIRLGQDQVGAGPERRLRRQRLLTRHVDDRACQMAAAQCVVESRFIDQRAAAKVAKHLTRGNCASRVASNRVAVAGVDGTVQTMISARHRATAIVDPPPGKRGDLTIKGCKQLCRSPVDRAMRTAPGAAASSSVGT